MTNNLSNIITSAFSHKTHLTKSELEKVLAKYYTDHQNDNTLNWRIHDLKNKGIIQNFARGVYSLADKKEFQPDISTEVVELFNRVQKDLPYTTISVIDTKWFNEFIQLQVFKTNIIVEAEKIATSNVFNNLIDAGKKAFLNPDPCIIERYVSNTEDTIIVKSLITESPVIEYQGIKIASLEKMLVDCIADTKIYGAQSQEMDLIFKAAAEKYSINTSTLKRYARRRNRTEAINKLIQEHLDD
jgi:hypothetical protein